MKGALAGNLLRDLEREKVKKYKSEKQNRVFKSGGEKKTETFCLTRSGVQKEDPK